jgi:hypothetical protein
MVQFFATVSQQLFGGIGLFIPPSSHPFKECWKLKNKENKKIILMIGHLLSPVLVQTLEIV